jgi:hypothetical protein
MISDKAEILVSRDRRFKDTEEIRGYDGTERWVCPACLVRVGLPL